MSIVYEFFKEDVSTQSLEDHVLFFIDYYEDFLEFYRIITIQHQRTKAKKERAHVKLSELRESVQLAKKKKKKFTEAEKLSIQERTELLEAIREEDDIIYYQGKPMDLNEVTQRLIKYQKIFKCVEEIDTGCRIKASSVFKRVCQIVMWPLSKMLTLTIDHTLNETVLDALSEVETLLDTIPTRVEKRILRPIDVDINSHLPTEKQNEVIL